MIRSKLINSIFSAFKNVKLEDGIGLFEADCIDDYIQPNDPVYISWKQKDERDNWENLLPLFLNNVNHERVHSSNFFFMDAKSKRFHLPCYLLQDLDEKHNGNNPLITSVSDLEILNAQQKQVVIDFFDLKLEEFIRDDNDYDLETYGQAKELFRKYYTL